MIDFSTGNSRKQYALQKEVCADVCRQVGGGDERIVGVMIEPIWSKDARISPQIGRRPTARITDACIGWEDSVVLSISLPPRSAGSPAGRSGRVIRPQRCLQPRSGSWYLAPFENRRAHALAAAVSTYRN